MLNYCLCVLHRSVPGGLCKSQQAAWSGLTDSAGGHWRAGRQSKGTSALWDATAPLGWTLPNQEVHLLINHLMVYVLYGLCYRTTESHNQVNDVFRLLKEQPKGWRRSTKKPGEFTLVGTYAYLRSDGWKPRCRGPCSPVRHRQDWRLQKSTILNPRKERIRILTLIPSFQP